MMMYSLQLPTLPAVLCRQQPHHSCLDGYHVDGTDCCLISLVLGVTMRKISANKNTTTTQYLQILPSTQLPNASIVLTLSVIIDCFSDF